MADTALQVIDMTWYERIAVDNCIRGLQQRTAAIRRIMIYQNKHAYKEFIREENNILRAPYNPELEFYGVIKSGDVKKAKELCKEAFTQKAGLGTLSQNPLQNMRYHFAITIALLARYCIEGGMDMPTSYALSDYYIQKVDACRRLEEIDQFHYEAVMDYVVRMKKLRSDKICSIHVVRCIEYMQEHLHTRITMEDLAQYTKRNPAYLSRLFKKETGLSVSEYIRQMKVEASKNMLLYSDYSAAQIATILAFADQSHYTEVFHKMVGVTPKQYQVQHLRELSLQNQ